MESVLVILLNETRAYQQTFNLFKKNLLDVFQADLCLCVANNEREDTNNPFYQQAKYVWDYNEPDDWGDAFDDAQKIKGYSANWRCLLKIKDQWLGGVLGPEAHPGSGSIGLFFRWFLKESILKNNVLDRYDRFIITRSDYIHQIPHLPLKHLSPEHIWIPKGEDYRGLCDRHLIAQKNDIIQILSAPDEIISNPDRLYKKMAHLQDWNPERFMKFHFESTGISSKVKRFPASMYTIRIKDGHTRWRKGTFSERLGYYIKYNNEYRAVLIANKILGQKVEWVAPKILIIKILVKIDFVFRSSLRQPRKIVSFLKKIKNVLFCKAEISKNI